jgi:hypothetical protein
MFLENYIKSNFVNINYLLQILHTKKNFQNLSRRKIFPLFVKIMLKKKKNIFLLSSILKINGAKKVMQQFSSSFQISQVEGLKMEAWRAEGVGVSAGRACRRWKDVQYSDGFFDTLYAKEKATAYIRIFRRKKC